MHKYTALISSDGEKFAPYLEERFELFLLPPFESLAGPVASHADMLVFNFGHDTVLYADYAEANPELACLLRDRCAQSITLSTHPVKEKYPLDVGLNALVCTENVFSLTKHCADEVKKVAEKYSLKHQNVRQGYSACSSLSINGGVVSADRSILNAARKCGIDTLEISSGNIILEGYNEGFIGGASGVCDGSVYFLGNIDTHQDGEKIRKFLKTHGYDIVCLGDGPLTDVGGIKFFENFPLDLA